MQNDFSFEPISCRRCLKFEKSYWDIGNEKLCHNLTEVVFNIPMILLGFGTPCINASIKPLANVNKTTLKVYIRVATISSSDYFKVKG